MKALSLWQPWASAMALGLKQIETRGWEPRYRGRLAIHAAKRWTASERLFTQQMGLPDKLPLGEIVAVGDLVDVQPTEYLLLEGFISDEEFPWGDYGSGRFGWLLHNIQPLERPIPFRGAQSLFEIPDNVIG